MLPDLFRAVLASGCLVFAGWISVGFRPTTPLLAQMIGATPAMPSVESFPEFAIRQGGAFAILALVLFFYRRDWRELTDYKSQRETTLITTIKEHTIAMSEMAAALRENNIVVHQTKNVLASVEAVRRSGGLP